MVPKPRPVKYVEDLKGCHVVTSHSLDKDGYVYVSRDNKRWRLHRLVYTQNFGPIPSGLVIRHRCDNPTCINIDHLEIGTVRDNYQDAVERGLVNPTGETNPRAILTKKDVQYIRKRPDASRRELSNKFGVSVHLISAIRSGRLWRSG